MADIGKLFVTIATKLDAKGLDASVTRIKALEKKTENIRKGFKMAGAALTAFAVAGAVSIMKLTNMASRLEETSSKFNVVFENQIDLAKEWSKELVKSYGVSTEQAKRFLSSIQDLLVPMGMESDAAAKLSNEVVKLAIDLGSFNNMPTERVMLDIQSALVGNFETMKKYGVVLNETVIKQEAMNTGLWDGKGMLDASIKAQVAYSLMVKGSTAAIGDFNRTSEGYANMVKIMQSSIEDFAAQIGFKLIPFMKTLVGMVTSISKWFQNLSTGTVNLIAKTLLWSTAIAAVLGPLALLIGFLPQIALGFIAIKAAIDATTIATGKFYTKLLAHPYTLVLAGIVALTAAIYKLMEANIDNTKVFKDSLSYQEQNIAKTKEEIKVILEKVKSIELSNEERSRLMFELSAKQKAVALMEEQIEKEKNAKLATEQRRANDAKRTEARKHLRAEKKQEADFWVERGNQIQAGKDAEDEAWRKSHEKQITMIRGVQSVFQSSFQTMFVSLLTETKSGTERIQGFFQSMADAFISAVASMMAKWAAFQILTKIFGIGGGFTKFLGFQTGVRNFAGGMAMVGEAGPELVNLPRGSDVHTAGETKRMVSSTTINVMVTGNTISDDVGADGFADIVSDRILEKVKNERNI